MSLLRKFSLIILCLTFNTANAAVIVTMNQVEESGAGKNIGTVTLETAKSGVLITPNLEGLTPGIHGFHIHEFPSCADKAMAAGAHHDPKKTEKHEGPYDHDGHLGDLPVLIVDKDGKATLPTFAPRLTLDDFKNHAIMIHIGSDNYSDTPEKLGGGGARIACGVVPK